MAGFGLREIALPAEFRLAAACAIWPHSEKRVAAVSSASREAIDWDRFLGVAAHHGIVGLAHDGLRRSAIAVPAEIRAKLDARARVLAQRNLHMAREAVRVRASFAGSGVPVAFLKGLPLAMLAYGTIAFRDMIDLDILVTEDRLPAAIDVLRRMGYRQRYPAPDVGARNMAAYMRARKHFDFFHDDHRIVMELHWRLLDTQLLNGPVPSAESWVDVALAPNVTLPTLASDDLDIYLVLHGAQHGWYRLKWLADIAALCAGDHGRAGRLIENAARQGVSRPVCQALVLSARLFGAPMPALPASGGREVRWLVATALRLMSRGHGEIGPDDTFFGSVGLSLSRFLLKPGWRFKWSVLQTGMTTDLDLTLIPLSDRWRFLYPVLRLPLWLLRRIQGSAMRRARQAGSD